MLQINLIDKIYQHVDRLHTSNPYGGMGLFFSILDLRNLAKPELTRTAHFQIFNLLMHLTFRLLYILMISSIFTIVGHSYGYIEKMDYGKICNA